MNLDLDLYWSERFASSVFKVVGNITNFVKIFCERKKYFFQDGIKTFEALGGEVIQAIKSAQGEYLLFLDGTENFEIFFRTAKIPDRSTRSVGDLFHFRKIFS